MTQTHSLSFSNYVLTFVVATSSRDQFFHGLVYHIFLFGFILVTFWFNSGPFRFNFGQFMTVY